MNDAMEYIKSDSEFNEIYENAVKLSAFQDTIDQIDDPEILREHIRAMDAHAVRLVNFLTRKWDDNFQQLHETTKEAQQLVVEMFKQQVDLVDCTPSAIQKKNHLKRLK